MSSDPRKPANRPPSKAPNDGPTPAGAANDEPQPKFVCALCGFPMYGAHCKLNCPNCGYREDCSDLFRE